MAVPLTTAMQTQIANLYISILGRNPDPVGFGYWCDVYANANGTQAALDAIASGFGKSPEFTGIYSGQTPAAAVALMYNNILGRTQDTAGAAYWTGIAQGHITSGKTVGDAYALTANAMITAAAANTGTADATLIASKQATAVTAGTSTPVTTYTLTTAAPETITALGTNNVINGTQTTLNANDSIIGSVSGTTRLNLVDTGTAAWSPTAASITNVQTVALRNINGTAAVPAVDAVNEVQTSTLTGTATGGGATTTVNFLGVASASVATGAVASTVAAAITAAKAAILAGTQAADLGLIDISNTGAVLTLTFSSAKGNVANIFSPVNAGITFGPGVQTTQGVAGVPAVAAATFADSVVATRFGGATTFINDVSTSQVDFSALASTQTVQINGNGSATNANTTAAWASGVTSASATVNGGVTAGTITFSNAGGAGIATVTLTSTGSATGTNATAALGANVLGGVALGGSATALNIVANNNLTTGNVTGFTGTTATITVTGTAGALNLGTLEAATVGTVNASAFAGGVTTTLNNNVAMAFTGGAGNDTVTTGAVLTTGTVNAGGGTGDILVAADVNHVNTSALAAKYTNFEILRVNGTMDASLISGITQVQLSGATNSIANLSAGQSVYARANIGATTLAPVSGTTNTLNLTMGNSGTTVAAALSGALTINGYQTLNLTVTPGATTADGANKTTVIDSLTAANLTAINLTGTAATITNAATTLATTINGSALTGNGNTGTNIAGLTIGGNLVSGSSVIGSALRDQFTLGTAGNNTFDGGGGNDLFITTVTNLGTGGASDPTLIGGAGTDTLRISNATVTLTDANFKKVSGFEALNIADASEAVSITGLTTNANAAFTTGLTVTSGTLANDKTFAFESLAYANNVTLTLVTDGNLASTADNITITTGAGADTISVDASAAGVAVGGAGATIAISTGSAIDNITVKTGTLLVNTNQTVAITAGTGADVIDVTTHVNNDTGAGKGNVLFTIAAGDSTTTAYDAITGFKMSDIGGTGGRVSDALDFASVALNAYAATAAAGYTAAQLTVAVSATGVVTLAGTSAATLTLQQTIDAVQSVVTVGAGDTALFTYAVAGVTSTYVFNNNATADSVVQLVGISGAALITTNGITVDNGIFIV